MAYLKGRFKPRNPNKYRGDPTNIIYRSGWELKVMMSFDHDPSVLEWSSEETIIPYMSPRDGAYHRYFPDFKVRLKEGIFLVEVKPLKDLSPSKSKNKQKYLREF